MIPRRLGLELPPSGAGASTALGLSGRGAAGGRTLARAERVEEEWMAQILAEEALVRAVRGIVDSSGRGSSPSSGPRRGRAEVQRAAADRGGVQLLPVAARARAGDRRRARQAVVKCVLKRLQRDARAKYRPEAVFPETRLDPGDDDPFAFSTRALKQSGIASDVGRDVESAEGARLGYLAFAMDGNLRAPAA